MIKGSIASKCFAGLFLTNLISTEFMVSQYPEFKERWYFRNQPRVEKMVDYIEKNYLTYAGRFK